MNNCKGCFNPYCGCDDTKLPKPEDVFSLSLNLDYEIVDLKLNVSVEGYAVLMIVILNKNTLLHHAYGRQQWSDGIQKDTYIGEVRMLSDDEYDK